MFQQTVIVQSFQLDVDRAFGMRQSNLFKRKFNVEHRKAWINRKKFLIAAPPPPPQQCPHGTYGQYPNCQRPAPPPRKFY